MGSLLSKISDVWSTFTSEKPARILMLGLDAAGKTTILYHMIDRQSIQTLPTIGFNVETVSPCPGVVFTVWDVGGQEKLRGLWRHYYYDSEGVVFVIDSNDPERISEARRELHNVLNSSEMTNVPVVIIANKQDLPNAMKPAKIIHELAMNELNNKHQWFIQPACAISGQGLSESMLEMAKLVKEYRKRNK